MPDQDKVTRKDLNTLDEIIKALEEEERAITQEIENMSKRLQEETASSLSKINDLSMKIEGLKKQADEEERVGDIEAIKASIPNL